MKDLDFMKDYQEVLHDNLSTIIKQNILFQTQLKRVENDKQTIQELNNQLNTNLKKTQEANKAIAKLLADTDIIKNSLADPKASEEAINEQIDLMFGAIGCATGTNCVQQNP